MDSLHFTASCTAIISGATESGKITFTLNLLRLLDERFTKPRHPCEFSAKTGFLKCYFRRKKVLKFFSLLILHSHCFEIVLKDTFTL